MPLSPEKYRILRTLDVEAVREDFVAAVGEPEREDTILASLHKARILAGRAFPRRLREESREWLRSNGYEIPDITHS